MLKKIVPPKKWGPRKQKKMFFPWSDWNPTALIYILKNSARNAPKNFYFNRRETAITAIRFCGKCNPNVPKDSKNKKIGSIKTGTLKRAYFFRTIETYFLGPEDTNVKRKRFKVWPLQNV